ncbi:MAG: HNH endonuclease [Peptostreptococcaceae bacterium]
MLKKLCSKCNSVIEINKSLCNNCTKKYGSVKKASNKLYQETRKDKDIQAIYKSAKWLKVRKLAIQRANGLCEECIKLGNISYVQDVHHKVPVKDDKSKAYDIDNLICLCRKCHLKAHQDLDRSRAYLNV